MNLQFADMREATDFAAFLLETSPDAIFLVDTEVKIRLINSAYKEIFSTSDEKVLNKPCGNGFGCAFAVEANCDCGEAKECQTCLLRKCIADAFAKPEKTQTTTLERVCYVNGKPGFKYFDIKAKHVTYCGEDMTMIIIDNVMDVNVDLP